MFTTRRARLTCGLVCAAALSLTACADSGAADTDALTIGIFGNSTVSFPVYVGEGAGIFEAHGLDTDIIETASGPELTAALFGGTTDVSLGTPGTIVPSLQQGQQVQAFPPYGSLDYRISVPTDSDIESIADLSGKRFVVPARGGAVESFVTEMLTEEGVDPASVTFIAGGGGASQVPMIREGNADAVALTASALALFEAEGLDLKVIADPAAGTAGDVGDYGLNTFFATTTDYVNNNPERVTEICDAFADINTWMADPANAEQGAQIMKDTFGLNDEAAAQVWDYESQLYTDQFDETRWQENVDWISRTTGASGDAPLTSAC